MIKIDQKIDQKYLKMQQPGNMAFIDIEHPVKQKQTVQDYYIKNKQEIRTSKKTKKVHGITQRHNIQKVFQLVVQAT